MTIHQRIKFFSKPSGDVWLCILILLIATVAYLQIVHHPFVSFDDPLYVSENARIQKGLTTENIRWAFEVSNQDKAYWHPLTWISHMLDCELFGLRAGMHHLTSLILHLFNTILVFWFFKRATGARWKSAIVAALFALHPINVDSVAWVSERKNVLSTFFWLLTMLAYIRYAQKPKLSRYALTLTAFSIGLLAKPMLVTLPCVLVLMDFWPLGRFQPKGSPAESQGKPNSSATNSKKFYRASPLWLILEKLPMLALSAFSVWISSLSLHHQNLLVPTAWVPISLRIENALVSYARYVGKALWPFDLATYYPFPTTIPYWKTAAASMFLIGVTGIGLRLFRSRPWFLIGWLWFLGTLVPVSGLVQGGLWPAMADRWAYVPFLGLYIIGVWGGESLAEKLSCNRFVPILSTAVVLAGISITTWIQIGYWKNSIDLFQHALEVNGEDHFIYNSLGSAFYEKGDEEKAKKLFEKAAEICPTYPRPHLNLGLILLKRKKYTDAIEHFQTCLKISPGFPDGYNYLGLAHEKLGQLKQAAENYEKALQIDPRHKEALYNYGHVLALQGANEKAVTVYRKLVRKYPGNVKAHFNLGALLVQGGKIEKGEEQYRKALSLAPGHALSHYNLGLLFAQRGNRLDAIDQFKAAVKADPSLAMAHYSLGMMLSQDKRTENDAIRELTLAIEKDPKFEDAYINLGLLLVRKGKSSDAETRLAAAARKLPESAKIFYCLGKIQAQTGRMREAMTSFTRAESIDPTYAAPKEAFKATNKVYDSFKKALKEVQTALELNPENRRVRLKLCELYQAAGTPEKAAYHYEQLLERNPDDILALHGLATTKAGMKNFDDAILLFQKILSRRPESPSIHYNIACMYALKNEKRRSINWLRKAVDMGYTNWSLIQKDPDLENIRNEPAYQQLIEKHR